MQEILDAALERVPERAKVQFALLVSKAEHGGRTDDVESLRVIQAIL
jgi:hypothetical protein